MQKRWGEDHVKTGRDWNEALTSQQIATRSNCQKLEESKKDPLPHGPADTLISDL